MRRVEQGFTLIEVLVALVMTGVLLVIILDGAAGARARSRYAAQHEDAVRLGQSVIARATTGDAASLQGHGSEAGLNWTLARTVVASDPRGLYALTETRVDIASKNGKRLESFTARHLERVSTP